MEKGRGSGKGKKGGREGKKKEGKKKKKRNVSYRANYESEGRKIQTLISQVFNNISKKVFLKKANASIY